MLKKCNLEYTIIKFMRPSTLFESNSKGKINELYESELSEKYKKILLILLLENVEKLITARIYQNFIYKKMKLMFTQ